MEFVRIESQDQLEKYLASTADHLGIQFPLSYFKKSKVFACYNKSEIVAGFSIILDTPFRVLSSIPEASRCEKYEQILNSSVEITGLWISDQYRSKLGILSLIESLTRELHTVSCEINKNFAVYAYDFDQKNLQTIYSRGTPISLFEGYTIQQIGMPKSKFECIEYLDITTLRQAILTKYPRLQKLRHEVS
ncbi:MAG: hypothetical protein ACKOX6_01035 [Bdellovibrio sp.]